MQYILNFDMLWIGLRTSYDVNHIEMDILQLSVSHPILEQSRIPISFGARVTSKPSSLKTSCICIFPDANLLLSISHLSVRAAEP
jgi:hypothetical protein